VTYGSMDAIMIIRALRIGSLAGGDSGGGVPVELSRTESLVLLTRVL
jgi:hypothetical protein